jgi:hypothetical protein
MLIIPVLKQHVDYIDPEDEHIHILCPHVVIHFRIQLTPVNNFIFDQFAISVVPVAPDQTNSQVGTYDTYYNIHQVLLFEFIKKAPQLEPRSFSGRWVIRMSIPRAYATARSSAP